MIGGMRVSVTNVAFWLSAFVAILSAWRVFRTDSMVRAAYWLMGTFVAVAAIGILVGAHFLGLVLILMMAGEMTIMAVFMVMFMMNPAGLNPMMMVHHHRWAALAGTVAFLGLAVVGIVARFPVSPPPTPDGVTAALGTELLDARLRDRRGGAAGDDDRSHRDRQRAGQVRGRERRICRTVQRGRGARPGRRRVSLSAILVVAAALFGIGVYGALSQQSFVMIMMGLELMLAAAILATMGLWSYSAGATPKGQLLAVVLMAVMAVEAAIGFALVTNVYRIRRADITEKLKTLRG
jgi:NADH:ubiquinone oxidoreductase subunit K/NADH:ubiquinone oxidoreductase subunit 6 (subunit J)